ncbi:hypothetical protein Ae406Ps2_6454c [Pseudonocardia sp. Ae406_Ps2]|nr:hypothetical protein Ae406Ps2_6448c [Pseudonocardia sp. Ae406_Ps2]OLL89482.1 hypothetical protein Ae406Ps2_6454c [Pseudonocardia sp. Ae406_Ps2]
MRRRVWCRRCRPRSSPSSRAARSRPPIWSRRRRRRKLRCTTPWTHSSGRGGSPGSPAAATRPPRWRPRLHPPRCTRHHEPDEPDRPRDSGRRTVGGRREAHIDPAARYRRARTVLPRRFRSSPASAGCGPDRLAHDAVVPRVVPGVAIVHRSPGPRRWTGRSP